MVYGGGAWGRGTALLTADGKYILVAAASNVRLYSSATGEFVTSLNGHKADVTAVVLDHASNDKVFTTCGAHFCRWPSLHSSSLLYVTCGTDSVVHLVYLQIYSASLDGTVKHWDYTSGQLLQSFTVDNPIQSMVRVQTSLHIRCA